MSNLLLAGPILRRATENRVCVWIATSQAIDIQLKILDSNDPKKTLGISNPDNLYTQRTQLGENLFIYLLEARHKENKPFPLDSLLYYQLSTLNGKKNEPWDLSDLAYKDLQHPSFFIAEQSKNILHGSCRKPHGTASTNPEIKIDKKNNDALVLANKILVDNCQDLTKRPSMLLLTGDQIYADDVAIALLATLREQAKQLMGHTEYIPEPEKDGLIDPNNILLHGRKDFLKNNNSGFSSGASENHLLSFGEYAAMYLYVFGNLGNWKVNHTWSQLVKKGVANTEDAKEAYLKQKTALSNFNANLGEIRQLFANIPTYMLFDDHDVTDDWNITNTWYDRVKKSSLGSRVISNALAAYWGFQACGNDPDNFSLNFKSTLHNHLVNTEESTNISERYDLQLWRNHSWGFSIPSNPPVIAIDTRTQRASTPFTILPNLLDRYAKDWLVLEWSILKTNPVVNNYSQPIIIAPAPVLGVAAIEFLQKFAFIVAEKIEHYPWINAFLKLINKENFVTNKVVNAADIEAWASNKKSLDGLFDCLSRRMGIEQCTFLSGDVHYAFSANGKHTSKNPPIYCYQLTSSSLNNTPSQNQGIITGKMAKFSNGVTNHSYFFSTKRTDIHILASEKSEQRSFSDCNIGLIEFDNGVPAKHILKSHTTDDIVFNLEGFRYIDSL